MEEKITILKTIKNILKLENLPSFLIIFLSFITPLFFIPSSNFSLAYSKSILIFTFVIASFFIFLVSVLKKGKFDFPFGKIYISLIFIPVVFLISALFSKVPAISFMGFGFETYTFSFILVMFMFLFLVSSLFQSEKKVLYSYLAFFATFLVISLIHIVRLFFGPDILSFGLLSSPTTSLIGGWYDLSILCGAVLLLSLIGVEMMPVEKRVKLFLRIAFFVSFCFLVVINFSILWVILAILSLLFFVYLFSFEQVSSDSEKKIGENGEIIHIAKREGGIRKISVLALVILIASCFFLTPLVKTISGSISSYFNLSNIEVRPSWATTFDVAKNVLKDSFLLGSGPNTFNSQWQLLKPSQINLTYFWDTEFVGGIGYIPTLLVTTGALGFVSWVIFFGFFLYLGFVSIFAKTENNLIKYLIVSSFFVSLYFWIFLFAYIPGISIIFLTFLFTGLFFASLHRAGLLRSLNISFSSYPRASFAMVLSLVLLIVSTLFLGYVFTERTMSSYYYANGVKSVSEKRDLDLAEMYTSKAISLWGSDLYYRGFSELQIMRLANIVASVTNDNVSDEVKNEFQRILGNAIESANMAVRFDSTNYQNWVSVAKVYDSISPLGIEQSYENAVKAYDEAIKNSPRNPKLNLMLARLSANKKDFVNSKMYISKALEQKPNYTEAIFLRSQVEVADGDIKSAISSMEGVALISPNDAGVFFELGLLNYNSKDYSRAVFAFERAVILVPNYSNAKYFLGLSYEKLNKINEARVQFEDLVKLNPENEEVRLILKNLSEGRGAFADAEPPVDDKPEKRSSLPVEEKKN
jgi:tetratricopeptide (TPR) repeat protein